MNRCRFRFWDSNNCVRESGFSPHEFVLVTRKKKSIFFYICFDADTDKAILNEKKKRNKNKPK